MDTASSTLGTLDLLVGLALKVVLGAALLLVMDNLLGLIRVTRVYRQTKTDALRLNGEK